MGVEGNLKAYFYTLPITCQFESQIFKHSFFIVIQCPIPMLRWHILAQMRTILLFPEESLELSKVMIISSSPNQEEIPNLLLDAVILLVWESGILGRAKTALPAKIQLKPRSYYPHRKQYSIKWEALEGLQPIITKFIQHGLIVPCQSPCNTPILPVIKLTKEYRLVQDLKSVNEAVVPLHPVVANSYSLLSQVPNDAQRYSVLDLKDAFFCIPLHPDTQYLFLSGLIQRQWYISNTLGAHKGSGTVPTSLLEY